MIISWLVHLTAFPEKLPFQNDIFLIKYPLSHWSVSPFGVYKIYTKNMVLFLLFSIQIESSSGRSFVLSQHLTHVSQEAPAFKRAHSQIFLISLSRWNHVFIQNVSNSSEKKRSAVYFFPLKGRPLIFDCVIYYVWMGAWHPKNQKDMV